MFTDLSDAVVLPPTWVVKDLLPTGLTVLASPPKTGKSTLTMALSALVTGHECKVLPPHLSKVPETGKVLVFSYEASAGELRATMEQGLRVKLHPDSGIEVADDPFIWRFDSPTSLKDMTHYLEEHRPKLVILDPLRNFHSLDENDSGQMVELLAPLRKWAVEHDSSLLVVHHTRKAAEQGQVMTANDMRGSSALFGLADGIVVLTRKGMSHHFECTFKRAPSWSAAIVMATWGVTDRGFEVIPKIAKDLLALLKAGATKDEAAESVFKMKPEDASPYFDTLIRLGLVDSNLKYLEAA